MAFKPVNFSHLLTSNSVASRDFLQFYNKYVTDKLTEDASEPAHQTFAPSSFRCNRISWFRLRGTAPDVPKTVDTALNFIAQIGTACHRIVQENLKSALGEDWIAVEDYLAANPIPYEYTLSPSEDSLETHVSIEDPPIRFACDGIVKWKGKYYLLEIKTSEFKSWDNLTAPKSEHLDQIKCYATLLGLAGVLVLYVDRQYGGIKVYELSISDAEKSVVRSRFDYVREMVDANLAPDPLPKGDKWCSPAMCPYYKKCAEWGR